MPRLNMGISLEHLCSGAKGKLGEDIAIRFLERRGFRIITRNYRKKWGEIDIVAFKDGRTHFFEAKSVAHGFDRRLDRAHPPEENVHAFKARQISRMIRTYFAEMGKTEGDEPFSFHVLAVFMDMSARRARVKWLKDVIL